MVFMFACEICDEPLVLRIDDEEENEAIDNVVPDDLELSCGCHFHWYLSCELCSGSNRSANLIN